jgi:OTU domain-containing protein 6
LIGLGFREKRKKKICTKKSKRKKTVASRTHTLESRPLCCSSLFRDSTIVIVVIVIVMGKKKGGGENGVGFTCPPPTDALGNPVDVETETLSEMRSRHKRELDLVREYCKTLVGKQAKTKALVEEGKVTDRHFAEEDALERRLYGSPDAVSEEEEEEEEEEKEEEDAGVREERRGKNVDEERQRDEKKQGPTKAQKRREKKAQEEKARELAIEMERARLRESGPSKKEIEEDAMTRALEAQNLKLREVKADGHCLYRAVAEQVAEMREESRYGEVRIMCANEMLKNREEYEAFVEVEEAGSFEKYCEKVESTAEWGGHVEMLAIARALKRNVEVFEVRPGGEVEKMVVEGSGSSGSGGEEALPLRVAFMKESYTLGEHYDAVVSV